jgi:putative spermidine/putrescine transport system substrate-binding protein
VGKGLWRPVCAVLVLGALALGLLAGCGGDDDDGGGGSGGSSDAAGLEVSSDAVVFADYGGTTRAARGEAFFSPFSDQFGARVVSADADPSKMQVFAENGRAEWDLLDVDGWDLVRFARDGLLRKLPAEVTRTDLVPEKYRDYGAGGYTVSVVNAYRSDKGKKPESWADFFDTKAFPGKRGLPNFAYLVVEAALLADGVPCDDLYPLDFDRAFAKLDTIRDDTLFWDSFGQGMQFLAQGSVSMTLTSNPRASVLKNQGLPVDLVWNDALLLPWTGMAIPKDAPHPDAAFALVDLMSKPEYQAQFARLTYFGPTNSKALKLLDEPTLEQLPNTPAHAEVACQIDPVAASEQIDEYTRRYTEWLAEG